MTTRKDALIKLFLGYELSPDLKLMLHQSPAWKQIQILPQEQQPVRVMPHLGKEYLGFYLPTVEVTVNDMTNLSDKLVKQLTECLPDLQIEFSKIFLFSQTQIS